MEKNLDKIFIAGITSYYFDKSYCFFQQAQEPKSTTLDRRKLVLDLKEKINKEIWDIVNSKDIAFTYPLALLYKNAFLKQINW